MRFYKKQVGLCCYDRKRRCKKGLVFLPKNYSLKDCCEILGCNKQGLNNSCLADDEGFGYTWEEVKSKGILGLFFEEPLCF